MTGRLAVLYLVTQICLAGGILSTKGPRDAPVTRFQSQRGYYLPPTATGPFPTQLQRDTASNLAPDNDLQAERIAEGHAYPKPAEFQLAVKDQIAKLLANQDSSKKDPPRVKTRRRRPGLEHHPQRQPTRPSGTYQVIEESDEYPMDDSAGRESGRVYSRDITTAIKELDQFLSRALNGDGYNTGQHPPSNPVLALLLSRYGRYVPGPRKSRVYAYAAANDLHNNQPFGRYKQDCEEEPRFTD